uniref:Uncharacterized protein n=1 Tax=Serinus canaria TaxID=9135 RepID=A0A8C9UH25_SERCA
LHHGSRMDLLQSQQGHKQLTEQDKVFLEQYKAQKEAEMLQYKNELGQLKLRIYQAQSDIPLWVRNCGVGRGRCLSLAGTGWFPTGISTNVHIWTSHST